MHASLWRFAPVLTTALSFAALAAPARALDFVVNSTAITDDGSCTAAANGCTLPEAINAANASGGLDVITFDPAVFPRGSGTTIVATSELPALTDPKGATIDGTGADVTINGNALAGTEIGLHFHTSAGINLTDVTVRNIRVLNFPGDGIRVCAGDPATCDGDVTDTTIDGVTSSGHGGEGLRVDAESLEQTTVARSTFEDNGGGGVTINGDDTNEQALITECSALSNDDNGFVITSMVNTIGTTVTESLSKGNGLRGIFVASNGNASDTLVFNNSAEGNTLAGIGINAFSDVLNSNVTNNTSNGNSGAGIEVIGFDTNVNAFVLNNTAQMNQQDGINVAALGALNNVFISVNLVTENMDDGIQFGGTGPTQRANGNVICGNAVGMRLFGAMTAVDAEANWWGDASGPTHPDNPAGTGDSIADSENGGEGDADFIPFINAITASANPDPASAGLPTTVVFQFSGRSGAEVGFLDEGPGDLNAQPPFTLTTTNGELTSSTGVGASVSEFINDVPGTLAVTLTPSFGGNANIALEGPCGLAAALAVAVLQADIAVTKTDDADPVEPGATITYTITVTNNGPTEAPNVQVEDQLPAEVQFVSATPTQGTCNESAGVVQCDLGALANGASATILIAVSADQEASLMNAVTASSDAPDQDASNNSAVEGTAVEAMQLLADEDCGAGMCGYGSSGVMPAMLLGLGTMKRRRQPES